MSKNEDLKIVFDFISEYLKSDNSMITPIKNINNKSEIEKILNTSDVRDIMQRVDEMDKTDKKQV